MATSGGGGRGVDASGSAVPEQLEASAAGVHALCCYLSLAASQQEVGRPEDAMPALIRILQVKEELWLRCEELHSRIKGSGSGWSFGWS